MPLSILVPMIVVGLILAIGLVHLTNRGKQRQLLDQKLSEARFLEDFPNFIINKVVLSDDREVAFILGSDHEPCGLVIAMGQNWLTRLGDRNFVRNVSEEGDTIALRANDFTLRKLQIPLADEMIRSEICRRLEFG